MNHSIRKNYSRLLAIGLVLPIVALACQAMIPQLNSPVETTETDLQPEVTVVVEAQPTVASMPVVEENHLEEGDIDDGENLVELYARVNPAVVNITVFGTQADIVLPLGQGSGFVIDEHGNIVTNAHVVHGAEEIEVTFPNDEHRSAEIVGEDLNSDLAVVRVEELPEGVNPLELGKMDSLAVGQTVIAIGNPFGLEGTLTRGVISALGRTIPALTPFSIPQSIQTDAAINPGNSGGPLLNLEGEVIGVNAQIETDGTNRSNLGVGFAIPVSIVRLVVPSLIEKGEYDWAWVGVRGGDLTSQLVEAMDLPVDHGAYISEVVPDGPADGAGLQGADDTDTIRSRPVEVGGDIITAINGQPVNSFDDLLIYIALKSGPGQEVVLTVLRDGEYLDVTVTLEERPSS